MKRLMRISYLVFVATISAFIAGFALFHTAEAFSPLDTQTGRLLERDEGERTVTRCSQRGSCGSTTYPTFTVIGEREDGTAWLVVGEGPYRAMGGERGEITVETSNLTGRVVGLAGEDDEWEQPTSRYAVIAFVGLGLWSLLVLAYERQRRTGRWKMGRFDRLELLAVIPGVLIGLVGVAVVTLGREWGLEVVTSSELESTFIADPFEYASVQDDASDNGPGTSVDESFKAARTPHTVVGVDHLVEDVRAAWLATDEVFALPVLRQGEPTGTLGMVRFVVEQSSVTYETVSCPNSLLSFPSSIDQGGNFGGFICFDRAAEGGTLLVLSGSIRIMDIDARPGYQLADGTIVDPPG